MHSSSVLLVTALAATSHAFPSRALEAYAKLNPRQNAPNATAALSQAETNCGPKGPCLVFSETEQFVSTTGQYAYASPSPDEIRGPCPGLNAAANHGYIPRNGMLTIEQTVDGLGQAYGMSPEFSAFLAAYAVGMTGDVLTQQWSIGGPMPATTVGGLLGTPQGISYSHNKYEGDVSIGRPDAYLNNGDAHSLDVTRFARAYASGLSDDRYTLDRFRIDGAENQYDSVRNNPYYFSPIFAGTLVAPAAYNFVINFMSNHSAEEPSGYLNGDMFKQFFAVTGDYPNFTWLPGQERIPERWYRRPSSNQYTAADGVNDLVIGWAAYPNTFRFGGNVNGKDSYEGIDIATFSGGTYNADTIFEGDNFACLFFQSQQVGVPDALKNGVNAVAGAVDLINKYSNNLLSQYTCPQLAGYDNSVFNKYPGRTYSPTGPATNY